MSVMLRGLRATVELNFFTCFFCRTTVSTSNMNASKSKLGGAEDFTRFISSYENTVNFVLFPFLLCILLCLETEMYKSLMGLFSISIMEM